MERTLWANGMTSSLMAMSKNYLPPSYHGRQRGQEGLMEALRKTQGDRNHWFPKAGKGGLCRGSCQVPLVTFLRDTKAGHWTELHTGCHGDCTSFPGSLPCDHHRELSPRILDRHNRVRSPWSWMHVRKSAWQTQAHHSDRGNDVIHVLEVKGRRKWWDTWSRN